MGVCTGQSVEQSVEQAVGWQGASSLESPKARGRGKDVGTRALLVQGGTTSATSWSRAAAELFSALPGWGCKQKRPEEGSCSP